MVNVLFKEKPFRTLVSLSDDTRVWYANALCKKTDTTYPHMLKILKEFEGVGLIRTEHIGRIRTIKLTETGRRLASVLETAQDLLDANNPGNSKRVLEGGLGESEESRA